jgi:hypothetical protein
MLFYNTSYLVFRQRPGHLLDYLTIPEQNEGRGCPDVMPACAHRILVDIELEHLEFSLVAGSEDLERRIKRSTCAAPCRKKINKHGDLSSEHFFRKRGIGYTDRPIESGISLVQAPGAFPAGWLAPCLYLEPVDRSALPAFYKKKFAHHFL